LLGWCGVVILVGKEEFLINIRTKMKQIERISIWIIRLSFRFSVWLIERFHNMKLYEEQLEQLRKLEKGTLGREIADCLDKHGLRLVPHFESHDLKHTLLEYKMTAIDEIRMQAFMIGNGNISIPSIAIFIFGFILLPGQWSQFAKDFRTGLNSKSIKNWTIETFADHNLEQLRKKVILRDKKLIDMDLILKRVTYAASVFSMLAGGIGMIYCLPYLFSSAMEDIVGAGFPFVGGALLFSVGLIGLSIRTKEVKLKASID
jgi:hypothetical protein